MRLFFVALVFWIFGALSALGYGAVTGGWYEYHLFTAKELRGGEDSAGPGLQRLINDQAWQIVPGVPSDWEALYFRRPRVVGWLRH